MLVLTIIKLNYEKSDQDVTSPPYTRLSADAVMLLNGLFKFTIATIASIATTPVVVAGSEVLNSRDANPIIIESASFTALFAPFKPLYAFDDPV